MSDSNFRIYASKSVVERYRTYSDQLQVAEAKIFDRLGSRLNEMDVLDIGVGAGRTTPFLASKVRTYQAIDFSPPMIAACQKKWQEKYPSASFTVCDMREMSQFETASFDFILISFNSLDYVDHYERAHVLNKVLDLLRPGGYLCFSTHNLCYLPKFFSISFRWHPIKFLRGLAGQRSLVKKNRQQIEQIPHAEHLIIADDLYDHGLHVYYIRPSSQEKTLFSAGFSNVRVFEPSTGQELKSEKSMEDHPSPWLYYLAQKVLS